MNPLYLHAEGYEQEVSVNTILGVVFPESGAIQVESEEQRRARDLEELKNTTKLEILISDDMPNDEIHILSFDGRLLDVIKIKS